MLFSPNKAVVFSYSRLLLSWFASVATESGLQVIKLAINDSLLVSFYIIYITYLITISKSATPLELAWMLPKSPACRNFETRLPCF